MLSRISLLTSKHQPHYQTLLKLTAPSQRLALRRPFSTENKPGEQASATATEEDYNLDEASATEAQPTQQKTGGAQRDRKRGFQKREEGAPTQGGMFKKRDANFYKQQQEMEAERDKPLSFEEYSQTKGYQLQKELLQLIKTKIGTADKEKVQRFYTKLNQQLRENRIVASSRLDETTIAQIKALIMEQKELDGKRLYEDSIKSEASDYTNPALLELAQKSPVMTQEEYENFMDQQEDILERELAIDEPAQALMSNAQRQEEDMIEEEEGGQESESYVENDIYNELLADLKKKLLVSNEEAAVNSYKVTGDITNFRQQLAHEDHLIRRAQGKEYRLDNNEDIDVANERFLDKTNEYHPHPKEEVQEFEELWSSVTGDIFNSMKDDVKSQYDQARMLMKLNQQLRNRLITQSRQTRQLLNQTIKLKDKVVNRLAIQSKDFQSDILPNKAFDFIKHEKAIQARTQSRQGKKRNLLKQYQERKFDHNSRDVEVFNSELTLLLSLSKHHDASQVIDKLTYLVSLLHRNVNASSFSTLTHSRLFEYSLLTQNLQAANQHLATITKASSPDTYAFLDQQTLQEFFVTSLKRDNFSGLGHLLTYLEQYAFDVSAWDLSLFKRGLDFHLNQRVNLNNVLIFTKYYTYFHSCRLRQEVKQAEKPFSQMSDSELQGINQRVFTQGALVDIRALFGHLVQAMGEKQAIDPVSKEDALWRIVDFFTASGIREIAKHGNTNYNTLADSDVSKYLSNRLGDSRAFEKVTQVLIRSRDSDALHNHVLQTLREYSARNQGSLPQSFDASKARAAYLRLKASRNANKDISLSPKTLEYFLFVFKKLGMQAEIVDLCENFEQLSGQKQSHSEIKQYYLADTLLNVPSKDHYHTLIGQAVFEGKEDATSAGYINAMTKAHLKDGAFEHAVKFFEGSLSKLRDIKKQREDFLVTLYDSVYEEDRDLSYEDYKSKYLDLIKISESIVKESFAVNLLKRVIADKQYEEIETLFQLYTVQKHENTLTVNVPQEYNSADGITEEGYSFLTAKQAEDYKQLQERKAVLQSKLSAVDVENMVQLQQLMKGGQVSLFNKVDSRSADELQKLFNIKSNEEVEDILKRTSRFQEAAAYLRTYKQDGASADLQEFITQNERTLERTLKSNMDSFLNTKREMPDRGIERVLEQVYHKKRRNTLEHDYQQNQIELDMFNEFMLNGEMDDENDPMTHKQDVHDTTLADLKEQLLEAVNKRREKVLGITIDIFNKVQQQEIKTTKLSQVESLSADTVDPTRIQKSLHAYNHLLNDPRSPVYSAIQTLAQYKGDKGFPQYGKLYRDIDDLVNNRIDLEGLQREQRQLEAITQELSKGQQVIKNIQSFLMKEQAELNKDTIPAAASTRATPLSESLERRVKQLYDEYKTAKTSSKDEIEREDKLRLMRDLFSLEFGGSFASSEQVFPAFYAQDLITFGLEHDIVEAVRLGEKAMSENGYTLSLEMQQAVKDYTLANSARYHKAMSRTGPIDNSTLYRRQRGQEKPVIMSMDDPYWEEFVKKNSARTQQWRVPSHIAWEHKPHGILSDVYDFKHVQDSLQKMAKYM